MNAEQVDHEVLLLQRTIKELGTESGGKWSVSFGLLFDKTQDIFEALAGTLKAAKKRGIISYEAPILLKGTHDKVQIVLLVEAPPA